LQAQILAKQSNLFCRYIQGKEEFSYVALHFGHAFGSTHRCNYRSCGGNEADTDKAGVSGHRFGFPVSTG
jgi:hypothetical protein